MRQTDNLALNLPEGADNYNKDDYNANFEIIDQKLQAVENALGDLTAADTGWLTTGGDIMPGETVTIPNSVRFINNLDRFNKNSNTMQDNNFLIEFEEAKTEGTYTNLVVFDGLDLIENRDQAAGTVTATEDGYTRNQTLTNGLFCKGNNLAFDLAVTAKKNCQARVAFDAFIDTSTQTRQFELFINGTSQGVKTINPNGWFIDYWIVTLQAGENTIRIATGGASTNIYAVKIKTTDKKANLWIDAEQAKRLYINNHANYSSRSSFLKDIPADRYLYIGPEAFTRSGADDETIDLLDLTNAISLSQTAFSGYNGNIAKIKVGNKLKHMHANALNVANAFEELEFNGEPESWKYGNQGCQMAKAITLGEDVRTIQPAFARGNTRITQIELPEGVTTINTYAFYGCSNLATIAIPSTITAIASDAFTNIKSGAVFNINMTQAEFEALDLEWDWASTSYTFNFLTT